MIKLKNLNEITPAQKEQLARIAADPMVMQYVANGQPWGAEKVSKLVHQAKADWREIKAAGTTKDDAWMHWAITALNDDVIGYLAIFPEKSKDKDKDKDKYFLRYFIRQDLQREGYGSQALRLAVAQFRVLRPDTADVPPLIYASVHETNLGGKAFLDKNGFTKVGVARKVGKFAVEDYFKYI